MSVITPPRPLVTPANPNIYMSVITDASYASPACTAATNQARGTVCTASCDPGYYNDGGNTDITCDSTGNWDSAEYLVCGDGCGVLPAITGKYLKINIA